MTWQTLGAEAPTQLSEVRLSAHFASQLLSGVGRTFLDHKADDSHTNLAWSQPHQALLARPLKGLTAALSVARLELHVLDPEGQELACLPLADKTMAEAETWVLSELQAALGRSLDDEFAPLHYEMPAHEVGEGEPFPVEPPVKFAELSRWFSNADLLLTAVCSAAVEAGDEAEEVRCWPHHFDIATLIELSAGPDGKPRSIGVGLSPGDGSYDEPYFYVSPYPTPVGLGQWPPLPAGAWHTAGFTSAVLTGSEALAGAEADQQQRMQDFLDAAVEACRGLLAG